MQTFLPHGSDFRENAKALDYRRLGKQRVETWQILNTLQGNSQGWSKHPAVLMWHGYQTALAHYGAEMCREWARRGYNDNMLIRFESFLQDSYDLPWWIKSKPLLITHRGNLYHKDPIYYAKFELEAIEQGMYVCCGSCDYWWPTHA